MAAQTSYPLLRFHEERASIVRETTARALAVSLKRGPAEYTLNDACLQELRRLSSGGSSGDEVRDRGSWRRLWRSIGHMSQGEREAELAALIRAYAEDVAGGFNRHVYGVASQVVPPALGLLLSPEGLRGLPRLLGEGGLASMVNRHMRVEGPLARLAGLAHRGTLVVVPTHLSNLDSPAMGYALQLGGLPPTTYGAGKNLFTNPLLGFFMRNCGAYRVDRRIRHELYKDVLKTYSQVILERGYHSMFFPGGTRSRSGRVEDHLKLGLLGTTLPATVTGFRRRRGLAGPDGAVGPPVRPIYIVPATINMQLTLEAETLIADYLQETGKARFIIEDDESASPLKVLQFGRMLARLSGEIVVRFGEAMDVIGNPVDEEGRSLSPSGLEIDLERYFLHQGAPQDLPQRDAEYMHDVAQALSKSYRENTVLMATHLLAHVVWRRICQATPALDLFGRLRHPMDGMNLTLRRVDLLADLARLQEDLRQRRHLLGPGADGPPEEVLDTAIRAFGSYHAEPAVRHPRTEDGAVSDDYVAGDRQLVYYYQNRVESLGVSR